MKKLLTFSALLALIGGITYTTQSQAQNNNGGNTTATQRSKIALVNIAKVLRDYKKANAQGTEISNRRKGYLDQVNAIRNVINEKNKTMAQSPDNATKEKLNVEMKELARRIEDIDLKAQKELTELSNDTIVRVYKEIQETIAAIAQVNNFELIMCYPDASSPTEENTAVVAQLKLQTPALMPFYFRKDMDITEYVVKALNDRYPAPANANITPTSATGGGTTGQPKQ